MNWVRFN